MPEPKEEQPSSYDEAFEYLVEVCNWETSDTHGWGERGLVNEAKQAWRNRNGKA